jgi:hypothetical protein
MHLPLLIARPLLYLLYRIERGGSPIPPIRREVKPVPADRQAVFDNLLSATLAESPGGLIDYHLPFPKAEFLNYLCDWCGYVAHGSVQRDLASLQPLRLSQDASEFGNRQQIFCSPDGAWALWFAILDKSKIRVTQNGCVRVGRGAGRVKVYHFDLPAKNRDDPPFTEGMIYLAHAQDFPEHHPFPLLDWLDAEFEEWGSANPVTPVAKLAVQPEDFPYLDKVQYRL